MKTQKNIFIVILSIIAFVSPVVVKSQNESSTKPSIAVVDFDLRGHKMNQQQVLQFLINELIRVGQFEVMDKYDIEYIVKKDSLDLTNCFSKICLTNIGKKLGVQKMLTGSISELGQNINVTIRVLDVKTGIFEKMFVKEFLIIPGNELQMIRVCMNDLFNIPNDQDMVNKLTKKSEFDNTVNNPYTLRLRSDGPRMGMTYATGFLGDVLTKPAAKGGYDGNNYMFQFGYQFEKQYLNEGNFQALFEFIPMITGLDQGQFIPSITLLNGLRNNKTGWEFAFGPTFALSKMAEGYIHPTTKDFIIKPTTFGKSLEQEAKELSAGVENRPDSRGEADITYGFLIAAGKTIKSGKLNLPVNLYAVPGKNGIRFGISMGWNGKERYEMNNEKR
jgi:TolB-like protein